MKLAETATAEFEKIAKLNWKALRKHVLPVGGASLVGALSSYGVRHAIAAMHPPSSVDFGKGHSIIEPSITIDDLNRQLQEARVAQGLPMFDRK